MNKQQINTIKDNNLYEVIKNLKQYCYYEKYIYPEKFYKLEQKTIDKLNNSLKIITDKVCTSNVELIFISTNDITMKLLDKMMKCDYIDDMLIEFNNTIDKHMIK